MTTRAQTGLAALGVTVLAGASRTLLAQDGLLPPIAASQWLAFAADLIKVTESAAFIFGAYQVFLSRKERKAADAEAARRAIIDSSYQAWQVINSAQGKGGSGGRVEALEALLRNGESLAGITLDDAWLEGVTLPRGILTRASLRHVNLTRADLSGANLEGADLSDANLVAANLRGAQLRGANVRGARLSAVTLDGADLADLVGWEDIRALSHASIVGVGRPPRGFVEFARAAGAVDALPADNPQAEAEDQGFSRHFRAL
jgi:hypothetical protein